MGYEDLRSVLGAVSGRMVAVDTPPALLGRIGFLDDVPVTSRMIFHSRPSGLRRTVKALARLGLTDVTVLYGSTSGLALARRSVDVLVCPYPPVGQTDLMRSMRRTAGVLVPDGILVMHGVVRRNPLGWMVHAFCIIARKDGGIPSELEITSWTLRAGFNRIVRLPRGRGLPHTVIQAHKRVL